VDHECAAAHSFDRQAEGVHHFRRVAVGVDVQDRKVAAVPVAFGAFVLTRGVGIVMCACGKPRLHLAVLHGRSAVRVFVQVKAVLSRRQAAQGRFDTQAAARVHQHQRPDFGADAVGVDLVHRDSELAARRALAFVAADADGR